MRLTLSAPLIAAAIVFATPVLANTTGAAPQFKSEAEAKSACASQPVVWANTSSHVLHTASSKYFGKTKHGAYMCENTAMQSGYHMAKNGQ